MVVKNRSRRRNQKEEKEFEEYLLQLDRVMRMVKGGGRISFRATILIGNRAGQVGVGLGKGVDVQIAIRKASAIAKKNLIQVPIVNDTIPHLVKLKYKAARILILPASQGTGLIAGSAVRKVLELAGVKNVLSKNFGTQNRVVLAQAMLKVLQELRMTEEAKKFLTKLKQARANEKNEREAKRESHLKSGSKNFQHTQPRDKATKVLKQESSVEQPKEPVKQVKAPVEKSAESSAQ